MRREGQSQYLFPVRRGFGSLSWNSVVARHLSGTTFPLTIDDMSPIRHLLGKREGSFLQSEYPRAQGSGLVKGRLNRIFVDLLVQNAKFLPWFIDGWARVNLFFRLLRGMDSLPLHGRSDQIPALFTICNRARVKIERKEAGVRCSSFAA